jgi:hypothetical protein
MFHHRNSGQNQNISIANESFENVAKFKYLGTTLTNKNDIHDEIKSILNSGNACYYISPKSFVFTSHIKKPLYLHILNQRISNLYYWSPPVCPNHSSLCDISLSESEATELSCSSYISHEPFGALKMRGTYAREFKKLHSS